MTALRHFLDAIKVEHTVFALPFACVRRCSIVLRQAWTAASSRQNDTDRILPFSVRLSKRSTEMKPSMVCRIGFRSAARSK